MMYMENEPSNLVLWVWGVILPVVALICAVFTSVAVAAHFAVYAIAVAIGVFSPAALSRFYGGR